MASWFVKVGILHCTVTVSPGLTQSGLTVNISARLACAMVGVALARGTPVSTIVQYLRMIRSCGKHERQRM